MSISSCDCVWDGEIPSGSEYFKGKCCQNFIRCLSKEVISVIECNNIIRMIGIDTKVCTYVLIGIYMA